MTTLELLAYILTALLLQVAAGVGIGVWRRRAAAGATPQDLIEDAGAASTSAWLGWRDFRVVRRQFEDTAQSQ